MNCNNNQSLDHLTNAEYITHQSEPRYKVVVLLVPILSADIIRCILEYIYFDNQDLSERTIRRLETSIKEGNFEKFKFIYDHEYMKPTISNWFEYEEEWFDSVWNFYTLCSCWCRSKECKQCDPIRIHRNLYVLQCGCPNGKRYLAFKQVYCEAHECITIYKSNKSNKKHSTNEYQKIVDHIMASGPIILHYNNMIEGY